MRTAELIKEIKRLPLSKRLYVIEEALQSIKEREEKEEMERAAEIMVEDYSQDEELIAFTDLDSEEFYETR